MFSKRLRRQLIMVVVFLGFTTTSSPSFAAMTSSIVQDSPVHQVDARDVDLDEKNRLNKAVSALSQLGSRSYSDRFGGVYIAGDEVVVRMKGAVSDSQRAELVMPIVAVGKTATFAAASYSASELDAIVAQISSQISALAEESLHVTSVGVDQKDNVVRIGTLVEDIAMAVQFFKPRFGDAVVVEPGTYVNAVSTRHDSPGFYKAGLEILNYPFNQGCSSGFAVRAWNGVPAALTAGHCGRVGDPIVHGGPQIGTFTTSVFAGDMDAGGIDLLVGQASNWALRSAGWLEPIQSFSTAPTGSNVCAVGVNSDYRCGTVWATNRTITFKDGRVLTGMHCASFVSVIGDSGGAVYQFGTGVGIVSAEDGSSSCYTPVERIASRWGATPVTGPEPRTVTIDLNGKCLDADIAGGTGNGQEMQQWDCLVPNISTKNQAFYIQPTYLGNGHWSEFYTLQVPHNWRCVDFDLNNLGNGGKVQQWDCLGSGQYNQQFRFMRGAGLSNALQNVNNGRCVDIDIAVAPYANGTRSQQWDCNLQRQQRFTLLDRPVY